MEPSNATSDDTLSIPIGFLIELSEAQNHEDILTAFARWSGVLLSSERVAVLLSDQKGFFERWTAQNGQIIYHEAAFEIETTTVGKIFSKAQPAIVEDLAACNTYDTDFVAKMGFKRALYAPILVADKVFGILVANYREPAENEISEHLMLETLGRSLGVYVLLHGEVQKYTELASTDPLTGLSNRRAFERIAEDTLAQWYDNRSESTILMVDLDHFKPVNDTYGHDAGDQILKDVSTVIKAIAPKNDHVVRWGGEEFCCLLRDCGIEQGMNTAERLRQAIADHQSNHDGCTISVTASIGVASISQGFGSLDALLKASDSALYRTKESGRNRVVQADAPLRNAS